MSINSLPLDVHVLIFSYIPFRPRLLVLRLVCLLWSRTVPLSVRLIPRAFRHLLSQNALENFVNISHGSVLWARRIITAGAYLSTRLRSLDSFSPHAVDGAYPFIESVGLRSASEPALEWLDRHASRLTRLLVVNTSAPAGSLRGNFPELRVLKLVHHCTLVTPEFLPLNIYRLTALTLLNNAPPLLLSFTRLPLLQKLKLRAGAFLLSY